MSSLRWRNFEPRTCAHCGKTFEVQSLGGRMANYCGKTCSGRAKRHRRIMREVGEEIADAHAERPEWPEPTVGEEFARFRAERKARMAAR